MSEKEMNSYRFTSGQEPSDEMLAQIMKEVAQNNKAAVSAYLAEMKKTLQLNKQCGKSVLATSSMVKQYKKPELIVIAGPNGTCKIY